MNEVRKWTMDILQEFYILIFNRIFKYTSRINEKIRDGIALACIIWLVASVFILPILTVRGVDLHTKDLTVMGNYALIVLCIFSIKEPLKKIHWNAKVTVPYLLTATYMVLMSIDHYTGECYGAYAVSMLLIFPALYFVWGNRRDYSIYYRWLSVSIGSIGCIILIAHFIFAPVSPETLLYGQYVGLSINPNRLGMVTIVINAAALYLLSFNNKLRWIWAVVSGICIGITYLTASRTAIIVIILQLLAWILVQCRFDFSCQRFKTILVIFISLVIIIGSCWSSQKVLKSGITSVSNLGVMTVHDKNAQEEDNPAERFEVKGKSANEFSAGRIGIWNWYLERMHIRGNDCTNHKVVMYSGKVVHNAHNTILEIGFRYGIPSAVGYLITLVILMIVFFKAGVVAPGRRYVFLAIFIAIAYYVEAMFDVMTLPYERGLVLLFYLTLLGVFDGDIFKKEHNTYEPIIK